jgi:hypothetical protein
MALYVVVALFIITFYYNDFLKWGEEISLFLPTQSFFLQCMETAGGLLSYGGTFLTCFFYYPFWGSILLILLLILIQFLCVKAFEIPKSHFPLSFIPAILLLLSVTEVGYVLFSLKSQGYLFSNSLGVMVILFCFWAYRNIKNRWIQMIFPALFIVLTYPLFGFYTLFAVFLCILYSIVSFVTDKDRFRFFSVITGVVCMGIIPCLYYNYVYSRMSLYNIYTAGLPKFYFTGAELPLWTPFIILFLFLMIFLIFVFRKQENRPKSKWSPVISFGIFILSLFFLYFHSFRDENFRIELKMNKAVESNNWESVVSIGNKLNKSPTRLIIMNYNLALYKLGKAGDQLFSMDNNSILHHTQRPNMLLMHIGAQHLYFQYGKINFSYRWCMENNVEYGMSVDRLKYMVKCSLVNGEFALAQKYINVLKKTFFYSDWAAKYQQYIDAPKRIAEDDELKAIAPLTAFENIPDGDGNLLEAYILNSFAHMKGGPPEIVELSLQCNMILKNIERFWPRFFLYAKTHDRIPVHYQEAALLYAYLENKVDISNFDFNKEVIDRFNQLIVLSKTYQYHSDEKNKAFFKPQFGKTFWYYYFFTNDIKTNY